MALAINLAHRIFENRTLPLTVPHLDPQKFTISSWQTGWLCLEFLSLAVLGLGAPGGKRDRVGHVYWIQHPSTLENSKMLHQCSNHRNSSLLYVIVVAGVSRTKQWCRLLKSIYIWLRDVWSWFFFLKKGYSESQLVKWQIDLNVLEIILYQKTLNTYIIYPWSQ